MVSVQQYTIIKFGLVSTADQTNVATCSTFYSYNLGRLSE